MNTLHVYGLPSWLLMCYVLSNAVLKVDVSEDTKLFDW